MRAAEYARAAKNRRAFLDAFSELVAQLQAIHSSDTLSSFPRYMPRPGREIEADQLAGRVAMLAGPAAEAVDITGIHMMYKPPGTWQRAPVNPVLIWSTTLSDGAMLDPHLMTITCGQALGLLESHRDEQAEREKGVVGAIAWFFTLGPRVRDAAGLPPRSARGALVTGVVATLQALLVAALGGALAIPIARFFGWGQSNAAREPRLESAWTRAVPGRIEIVRASRPRSVPTNTTEHSRFLSGSCWTFR